MSHWGIDGLKPYMRYSLAGGYQANGENALGLSYCIKAYERYQPLAAIKQEIEEAIEIWMGSPGHRRNILKKWHKKVNIGLAWDKYNFFAYQHFEGDYVEYDQLPAIISGVLLLSGKVKNGVRFANADDLGIQIYFDPPTYPLTQAQVSRTKCYGLGRPVAALREPLTGSWYYSTNNFQKLYDPCLNPYDLPQNTPAFSSPEAASRWIAPFISPQSITVPWITASKWTANSTTFSIETPLYSILHGEGIYTIILWGPIDGEDVVISQYSIFHGITPPDTYNPDNYN